MRLRARMLQIAVLLENPRSAQALLSWPKFSLTSFLMVSRLIKQGVIPRTLIDVGANVGQFAVASAKLFPDVSVHCFEPNPENLEQLQKNVSSLGTVHVYPVALGENSGEVEFHMNTYSPSSSILSLGEAHKTAFPSATEKAAVTVKLVTLDEALADTSLARPTLLKIDVQGYEAKTLMGAVKTLARVDYVVVETSFEPLYEGEVVFDGILSIMQRQGFHFVRPIDFSMAERTGEIVQMDALFMNT